LIYEQLHNLIYRLFQSGIANYLLLRAVGDDPGAWNQLEIRHYNMISGTWTYHHTCT
jgi:hypothetical protein